MRSRIQKWGNSLALRIPKSLAQELGLDRDVPVEVSLEEGKLIVRPVTKTPVTPNDYWSRSRTTTSIARLIQVQQSVRKPGERQIVCSQPR